MNILRLAIPSPLRRTFDYLARSPEDSELKPGTRIKVSFGRRELIGLLLEVVDKTDIPSDKLKPIIAVLDEKPVIPSYIIDLALWAADYYQHPLGDALFHAVPTYLRKGNSAHLAPHTVWCAEPLGAEKISSRASAQKALFELISAHEHGVSKAALTAEGANTALLSKLAASGAISEHEISATPNHPEHLLKEPPLALNTEQQAALHRITESEGFTSYLLDGVTGSGKTEVYLQAIHHCLSSGRQALVLVPEIGLTPQTLQRFHHRFRCDIVVMHSNLTDKQRFEAWSKAKSGQAAIVIGTRSAIFTPLERPGIIIVDEEHDGSFKQQDGFRYSARDLAIVRGHGEQIPVVLGSATPALESLANCHKQRSNHLTLRSRAGNAQAPTFALLDIRKKPLTNGFSSDLLALIKKHLESGTQALIFINRRGFAPSLMCHSCGWISECRRCDARMTLHQSPPHLHCHHCDSQRPIPRQCDHCGADDLRPMGTGTERAEMTLKQHFRDVPILRVDRDSTARKGAMDNIIAETLKGEPCILIGTQMLAKGHHFPKVTLVAILDADGGLFSTDFHGMERTAQLIMQVAGRAGRASHPGHVVLQTHQPDHPLLNTLTTQGYEAFAKEELLLRQQYHQPPFTHMALLRAEASTQGRSIALLQAIRDHFSPHVPYCQWSGPFPSPMEKRAGVYRAQVSLTAAQRPALQHLLKLICTTLETHPLANKVRWSVDVDPYDLY